VRVQNHPQSQSLLPVSRSGLSLSYRLFDRLSDFRLQAPKIQLRELP
jgi:hypothetical protein